MDNLTETKLTSEKIYSGCILDFYRDTVRLPNGGTAPRELSRHVGAVCIVPLLDDGRVIVERQFRYPVNEVITEIPAGKREPGEPPFITAQRELQEEVGATADTWTELGTLIPSPGCYGETLYLYMAQDLHFGATHPDEDEFLEPLRVPLDEAVRQCMDGTLTDAKTVAAILKDKILREQ